MGRAQLRMLGVAIAASVLAIAGCKKKSEPGSSSSGTSSGGTTGGGTTGSPTTGGSTGSSGSSGTTGEPGCILGSGGLPLAQLCVTASHGAFNYVKNGEAGCGQSITDNDVPHLSFNGSPGAVTLAFTTCDNGGLLGQLSANVTASVHASRLCYDPTAAQTCQNLGRALLAGADAGIAAFPDGGNACGAIFQPNVGLGAACDHTYECKAGLYCKPADGVGVTSCTGTCQPYAIAGLPCSDNVLCDPDSTCEAADGGSACVSKAALNETCGANTSCKPGFACSGNGKCATPVSTGGDCDADHPCNSNDTCIAGTCQAAAAADGNCSPAVDDGSGNPIPAGPYAGCASCLRCGSVVMLDGGTGADGGLAGKCQTYGALGAACQTDADCQDLEHCTSGACQMKPRPNEACTATPSGDPDQGSCLWVDTLCLRSSATSAAGVCGSGAAAHGAACSSKSPNLPTGCTESTDYCQDFPDGGGTCAALPTLHQTCTAGGQCASKLKCMVPDGGSADAGMCMDLPAASQPCDPNDSQPCASGLYCDSSNVCQPLKNDGQSCTDDSQCHSGKCGSASKVCIHDCTTDVEGCSNCKNGLSWLEIFIFFSLALSFPARRRLRRR